MFKVIRVLWSESLGTTLSYIEEVECPNCNHIFTRKCLSGCFHHHCDSMSCPKCNYPFPKYMQEAGKGEPIINPSKRRLEQK